MATYRVVSKLTPAGQEKPVEVVRLVEARQKASAIAFVAKDVITAEVATTEDILALGKQDVALEKAVGEGEGA